MGTWLVILTWFCLTTTYRSDDSEIRTMDRRLLLNDPNTLLNHIEALQHEVASLKSQVTTLNTFKTEVTSQKSEIEALQNKLKTINLEVAGSVYTVWGKKNCPAINGTSTLYTGITGGKPYTKIGGGVTTLCLPHNPDDAPPDFPTSLQFAGWVSHLHGSEYQFTYRKYTLDDDVPCAVCHVDRASSVLMIPAKSSCPGNWSMQYNGFLVSSGAVGDIPWQAFDYICLNNDAEYLTEGARRYNDDGHILYPVQAVCGSLPCPPYKNGQYITCAVCTL